MYQQSEKRLKSYEIVNLVENNAINYQNYQDFKQEDKIQKEQKNLNKQTKQNHSKYNSVNLQKLDILSAKSQKNENIYQNLAIIQNYLEITCFENEVLDAFNHIKTFVINLIEQLRQTIRRSKDLQQINLYMQTSIEQKDLSYIEVVKSNINMKDKIKTLNTQLSGNEKQQISNIKINSPKSNINIMNTNNTNNNNKHTGIIENKSPQNNLNKMDVRQKSKSYTIGQFQSNQSRNNSIQDAQKKNSQRGSALNINQTEYISGDNSRKSFSNKQQLQQQSQLQLEVFSEISGEASDQDSEDNNKGLGVNKKTQDEQKKQGKQSQLNKMNNSNQAQEKKSKNKLNEPDNPQYQVKIIQKRKNYAIYLGSNFYKPEDQEVDSNQPSPNKQKSLTFYKIQYNKTDFQQHFNEFEFLKQILDINKNELECRKQMRNNEQILYFRNLLQEDGKLNQYLSKLNKEQYCIFNENLLYLFARHEASFNLLLKQKSIIKSVITMNKCFSLEQSQLTIVNEIIKILECDRASVWIIDKRKNILWTKVAKGSKNALQIELGQGLVGYVAKTGETINILDAHTDSRFDSNMDKLNNYKTRSLLCTPIFNSYKPMNSKEENNSSNIVGVIQVINKFDGFFTQDDEGILKLFASIADPILSNSKGNETKMAQQNRFRQQIQFIQQMNGYRSLNKIQRKGQKLISQIFDVPDSRIFFYDQQTDCLSYYTNNNEEVQFDKNQGLTGLCFTTGQASSVISCYLNVSFNQKLDLNTEMPVITYPIKSKKGNIVGVIQVDNSKGIENIIYDQGNMSIPHELRQTLEVLGGTLGQHYENIILYKKMSECSNKLIDFSQYFEDSEIEDDIDNYQKTI